MIVAATVHASFFSGNLHNVNSVIVNNVIEVSHLSYSLQSKDWNEWMNVQTTNSLVYCSLYNCNLYCNVFKPACFDSHTSTNGMHMQVSHTKMFLSYLLQNPADSYKVWYTLSQMYLPQSNLNVFHLTWILYQHYLVKLKICFFVKTLMLENPNSTNFTYLREWFLHVGFPKMNILWL